MSTILECVVSKRHDCSIRVSKVLLYFDLLLQDIGLKCPPPMPRYFTNTYCTPINKITPIFQISSKLHVVFLHIQYVQCTILQHSGVWYTFCRSSKCSSSVNNCPLYWHCCKWSSSFDLVISSLQLSLGHDILTSWHSSFKCIYMMVQVQHLSFLMHTTSHY